MKKAAILLPGLSFIPKRLKRGLQCKKEKFSKLLTSKSEVDGVKCLISCLHSCISRRSYVVEFKNTSLHDVDTSNREPPDPSNKHCTDVMKPLYFL